jgi:hypothetical protein
MFGMSVEELKYFLQNIRRILGNALIALRRAQHISITSLPLK